MVAVVYCNIQICNLPIRNMKQVIRLLGLLTVFLIFVSSLPSSVEGQKLGQNPWENFQRFGRRLSNRNRANDRRGRPVSIPARRRPTQSVSVVDGRKGKTIRNRANNRSVRRNNRPERINGRNDRSNTRNDRIVKPVSVAASPRPNFSPRPDRINGRNDRSNTRNDRIVTPVSVTESPKLNFSPRPDRKNGRNDRSNTRNDRIAQPAAPITVAASPKPKSSPSVEDLREGKNLRNTFPFNTGAASTAGHHDHHDHHHHDHGSAAAGNGRRASQGAPAPSSGFGLTPPALEAREFSIPGRGSRQRGNGGEDDVALDIGAIAAAGERCIDKVVMVEETEYDDVITCKHSYSEKCHTTYATDFTPQQEEKCEENFKKSCYIEYKKQAGDEIVDFCFTPLVRNCDIPGPEECTTEYTSECVTRYQEHDVNDDIAECEDEIEEKCEDVTQGYTTEQQCTKWPVRKCNVAASKNKKYSPVTDCKKVPLELCGPGACPVEPGPEECQQRTQTVVTEVPQETCNLEPQRTCKHVTKLVPNLVARENCIDIPKEVCSRSRTNPRKVAKPVVKKWCYTSLGPKTPRENPETQNGNQGQGQPPPAPAPTPKPIAKSCNADYPGDYCPARRNDGTCNPECNTQACGFDGKDCEEKPPNGYLPPPQEGYDK